MSVTGIAFVAADTASGAGGVSFDEVFPSADGVVEFWLEGGADPRNVRATPKAGEARFSEVEFADTYLAHSDGGTPGRGTLLEVAGSPIIYHARQPSGTGGRVWTFNPVTGAIAAVTTTVASISINDVTVRDAIDFGYLVANESGTFRVRRWNHSSESTGSALNVYFSFSGPQPENIDIDPDETVWVSGDDGSSGPFVQMLGGSNPTWNIPEPTGYSYNYVDTIQAVAVGEAIGLAQNLSSTGDSDFVQFFRFTDGDADGVDFTNGVTVDGAPYTSWAASAADNILVQTGVKMAVLGEKVAALTNDGTILLGTLVRGGGWHVGKAGWGGSAW